MALSLNRAQLIGNLGRDPEVRTTGDGRRIANLAVATSESWKDKHSGERKERTEWHRVVIFNEPLVEIVEKYARKGNKVFVEGQLSTRKWTDNAGVERYTTEITIPAFRGQIIILERANGGGYPPPADSAEDYGNTRDHGGGQAQPRGGYGGPANDLDDEVPF